MSTVYSDKPKILVIRRDNIGDLVCTTPLIHALRRRFPTAWIGAMANSYNAPVLDGNPDLDGVYVYTKLKHLRHGESAWKALWQRWKMMSALRTMRLDDVIVATTSPQPRVVRLARWLRPKRVIAFGGGDVNLASNPELHEVEDVFAAGAIYGIDGVPPAVRIASNRHHDAETVAIHISARKPSQRWPADCFVDLMRELRRRDAKLKFMLLWSPGAEDDPQHPGDDAKAMEIVAALGPDFPIVPAPTTTLATLIDRLAQCAVMICADGGAMHVGAALGLPVVALFGNSSVTRWRPWGVPQRVLQAASKEVSDIGVGEVADAFNALRADTREPTH